MSDRHPWHSEPAATVLTALASADQGLTGEEAAQRLSRYGPNRLPPRRRRSPLLRLLSQFHDILIYVLLLTALVTTLIGHLADSGVILGVVVINALIGFIQEGKAERALDAIRTLLSTNAEVLRNGTPQQVPAHELVPGDVVQLYAGDKVPADLRLLRSHGLRIEEAPLTGESVPVEKSSEPVADTALLGDRYSMAYSGTLVTAGQGVGVVVATGAETELGGISRLLAEVETLTTPLLAQLNHFGRVLTAAIAAVAAVTFGFGWLLRGYGAEEMLLAAVGLAVAAIPEGLPAIVTITLAIGVQRMAARSAIVRRLPAVETLGSVSVICTDKTGTLTRNEMTVQSVVSAAGELAVSGVGYAPHGGFTQAGVALEPTADPLLLEIARTALLCNDAHLQEQEGEWQLQGDPTEGALLTLALKAGLELQLVRAEFPRGDLIPFESEHRFMATLHHDHAGHGFALVKGAPERVLEMCDRERLAGTDRPIDRNYWQQQADRLADRGQRLIALAFLDGLGERRELHFSDVEGGMTLLGLVGLIDPPRPEAIAAVASCRAAGVRVKMITGDHALTARAIGATMGIGDGQRTLTGAELEQLSDEALRGQVLAVDVFARASPEHKLRLVQALQAEGRVVAMTGDGVNDAPALRRADVGVAMGRNGTEVAKEAAEMVLTDDNFASIAAAVEEGRTVYDNIRKAILFILPTNGAEALTLICAILFGVMLPITPLQILWVNMITAVTLALALAFEPAESGVMARPPRNPREPLLSGFIIWRISLVSVIAVMGVFGLFLWARQNGSDIETARTIAVNTLVMFEVFYLWSTRFILEPVLNRNGLLGSRATLLAITLVVLFQLGFTYLPPAQALFATAPLTLLDWLRITLVAATVLLVVELEKGWLRRRRGAQQRPDT